jgi:hypothetical protein
MNTLGVTMDKLVAEIKPIFESYVRAALGAGLAVYLAGNHDIGAFVSAAAAAVLPPLLRWLNPNDAGFGRTK